MLATRHVRGIVRAWGKILAGYQPNLSIEITRECPLHCPGCYAYGSDHLGGDLTLRELQDLKGPELVAAMFALLEKYRPLHVSIVGGEPLVRYRELNEILPRMAKMGIYTQLVTSAVRPIPLEWARLPQLQIVVSIDGLQPEHDERRKPATYDRIVKHIEGHRITVHCTVTRQQARRDGYLEEFVKFWSANTAVSQLWISLYTPQVGEVSTERLTKADRQSVIADLMRLRTKYPKLAMPTSVMVFIVSLVLCVLVLCVFVAHPSKSFVSFPLKVHPPGAPDVGARFGIAPSSCHEKPPKQSASQARLLATSMTVIVQPSCSQGHTECLRAIRYSAPGNST